MKRAIVEQSWKIGKVLKEGCAAAPAHTASGIPPPHPMVDRAFIFFALGREEVKAIRAARGRAAASGRLSLEANASSG